jgi:4-hydroxy-tetrahydrodipicolinate synthase
MTLINGVFNILATPFTEQGVVDEESLRSLVEFQLKAGAVGLTILGIMAEVSKLSEAERDLITRVVIDQVNGRIPVIVNATHTGTRVVIETANRAADLGASGVMVAPPTNLRNLDAVGDFYRTVSGSVSIPIVVQDEPVTTGVIMPASLLANLGLNLIKLEEAPVPIKISRILEKNPEARIYGGLGGVYFLQELERGAVGTMTGFAYTEILVSIYKDFSEWRRDQAAATFYKYLPLISYEGQVGVGLAIRKEILRRRGAIRCSDIRSPGLKLDQTAHDEISRVLDYVQLI